MTFPILGGNGAVAGVAQANSLRFNDDDSAYLTRTPSSAGNRKTFTLSTWIKRSNLSDGAIIGARSSSTNRFRIGFTSNRLDVLNVASSTTYNLTTTMLFRDVSAWYHIVVAYDTTQATASNRIKVYVNGTEQTAFVNSGIPNQNTDTDYNNTFAQYIGTNDDASGEFFDGYFAEVHLIDGTAKAPTDFGEFDEDSGIWKPKEYEGTYGTNGFKLNFSDSDSLGADSSGNGNDFTPTNLASTDQTTDTPTNNFATINSINASSLITISEGNLRTTAVSAWYSALGTIYATSGKWYFESVLTVDNWVMVGVAPTSQDINLNPGGGAGTKSMALVFSTDSSRGDITYNNVNSAYTDGGHGINTGDIISVALDLDNNNVKFYKNNTQLYNLSNLLSDEPYTFGVSHYNGSALVSNFGQDGTFAGAKTAQNNSDGNGYGNFYYAPPSGYLALCTQNLATELSPTISDGSEYFNTLTWSGDNTTRSFTGLGFSPDWTWIKSRSDGAGHVIFDSVRGANKQLQTSDTDAEQTNPQFGYVSSFDSDGFTTTPGTYPSYESGNVNMSGRTYVGWNWRGSDSSAVSNTDGSITSTVSANTTAGFSILTFTGTTSNQTVGHGLNQPPEIFFVKSRASTSNFWAYTTVVDGSLDFLSLNTTNASGTASNSVPTSSVIYQNQSDSSVAYCFHSVEGYSKIGSYTGNGSSDGTFAYTGFRPAWVMIKRTDSTGQWTLIDTTRQNYNLNDRRLHPNLTDAEYSGDGYGWDMLSNGFKQRSTSAEFNGSGASFLYMAFAENPFATSGGVPVTAR